MSAAAANGSGAAVRRTEKTDAYWTLYECLLTTAKLVAPFVPFLAETLWQNLAVAAFSCAGQASSSSTKASSISEEDSSSSARTVESVHLCDYPAGDPAAIDEDLSRRMALVREIASLGHSARMAAKQKVRQPLPLVEIVLSDSVDQAWLEEHVALIRKELNVKNVEFTRQAEQYIDYNLLPDLKRLGPRLGKRLPALRRLLAKSDPGSIMETMKAEGQVTFMLADGPITLDQQDLQVRLQAKAGWAAAEGRSSVVVLSTELTAELIAEGHAREVVHGIQNCRKEMNCEYTDRIRILAITSSTELHAALGMFREYVEGETLAVRLDALLLPENGSEQDLLDSLPSVKEQVAGATRFEMKVAGESLVLYITPPC